MTILLPCPFCGFTPDPTDADCIYPATRPHGVDPETNKPIYSVWNINCYETGGGCSAFILGGSPEHCIEKWNTRIFTDDRENQRLKQYINNHIIKICDELTEEMSNGLTYLEYIKLTNPELINKLKEQLGFNE